MSLASAASDLSDLRDYAFEWALVDVETSGLVPRRDRVLSLAVVTLGPDGRQTGEFSTLLDPGCDPGPVHVHGLTADRLRGRGRGHAAARPRGSRGRAVAGASVQPWRALKRGSFLLMT